MYRTVIPLLVTLLPFNILAANPEAEEQLAQDFQQSINKFVESFNKGEIPDIYELYTKDAVLFPPNEKAVGGLDNIARWYKENYLDVGFTDLKSVVYRVERSGNLAMQLNWWEIKIERDDGTIVEDRGKTLNVWRLEPDGKWRVVIDAWSSDLPAAESAITPKQQ